MLVPKDLLCQRANDKVLEGGISALARVTQAWHVRRKRRVCTDKVSDLPTLANAKVIQGVAQLPGAEL